MDPLVIYEPRTYRDFEDAGRFRAFRVVVETSDLYVKALALLEKETEALIRTARAQIELAIARRSEFVRSLEPVDEHPADSALVARMVRAGKKAGTGPMAAVAGAVAEFVGRGLMEWSAEVMVENGGDLFIQVAEPVIVGIYAGASPFSGKVGLRVGPTVIPLGICTSAATVGPSLSLGKADAATVISKDTALADAVASGVGNRAQSAADLAEAVEWAMSIPGIDGALAIIGDKIAALGNIELVPLLSTGQ